MVLHCPKTGCHYMCNNFLRLERHVQQMHTSDDPQSSSGITQGSPDDHVYTSPRLVTIEEESTQYETSDDADDIHEQPVHSTPKVNRRTISLDTTYTRIEEDSEESINPPRPQTAARSRPDSVYRAQLMSMKQKDGERFRKFAERVQQQAAMWDLLFTVQCECYRTVVIDYSNPLVKEVVVAGINDDAYAGIKQDVMNCDDVWGQPIEYLIDFVEKWEEAQISAANRQNTRTKGRRSNLGAENKKREEELKEITKFYNLLLSFNEEVNEKTQILEEIASEYLTDDQLRKFSDQHDGFCQRKSNMEKTYFKYVSNLENYKYNAIILANPVAHRILEQVNGVQNVWKQVKTGINEHMLYLDDLKNVAEDMKFFEKWRARLLLWKKSSEFRIIDLFHSMNFEDARLTRKQFLKNIRKSGFETTKAELKQVCDIFDQDGDGDIDCYALLSALSKNINSPEDDEEYVELEVYRQVWSCMCSKQYYAEFVNARNNRKDFYYKLGESHTKKLLRVSGSVVRVSIGGGSQTLQQFLQKNDPCRGGKARSSIDGSERRSIECIKRTPTSSMTSPSGSSRYSGGSSTSAYSSGDSGVSSGSRSRRPWRTPMTSQSPMSVLAANSKASKSSTPSPNLVPVRKPRDRKKSSSLPRLHITRL